MTQHGVMLRTCLTVYYKNWCRSIHSSGMFIWLLKNIYLENIVLINKLIQLVKRIYMFVKIGAFEYNHQFKSVNQFIVVNCWRLNLQFCMPIFNLKQWNLPIYFFFWKTVPWCSTYFLSPYCVDATIAGLNPRRPSKAKNDWGFSAYPQWLAPGEPHY